MTRDSISNDFFQVVHHLQQASHELRFRPSSRRDFPNRDIEQVSHQDDGSIDILCRFMGLYGVDSPLPSYFNQLSHSEDPSSQVIRDFLDIINQRNYQLYFQAWLVMNSAPDIGDVTDFTSFVHACSGQLSDDFTFSLANCMTQGTEAGLYTLLHHIVPDATCNIKRFMACWVPIERNDNSFGQLGENSLLGHRMQDASGMISIEFSPLPLHRVQALCRGGKKHLALLAVIHQSLESPLAIKCIFHIQHQNDYQQLGTDAIILGQSSWLGENSDKITLFTENWSKINI